MLDPDAQYSIGARPIRVVRKDGTAIAGLLANQDSFSIQMRDGQGNLLSLEKSDLREVAFVKSPMPSYRGKLDSQELADLISYVGGLRGPKR